MNKKDKPYMQMSKKISIAVLCFYALYITTVTISMFIFPPDDNTTSTVQTVIGYLSGFSAIVLAAYFGNSGVEKYSKAKFNIEKNITTVSSQENDSEPNG